MQTQETKAQGKKEPGKLQARLDELKALRDEIRVRIHLGEMDARDAFQKIEPAVDKAEHELTHMATGAAEAVAKTLDSLAEALRKIHARLPK